MQRMLGVLFVSVAVVAGSGCAAMTCNGVKAQVRTYATSTFERTRPDGDFVARLDRICTPTATCQLSASQVKHCASLRASIDADNLAASKLLQQVKR